MMIHIYVKIPSYYLPIDKKKVLNLKEYHQQLEFKFFKIYLSFVTIIKKLKLLFEDNLSWKEKLNLYLYQYQSVDLNQFVENNFRMTSKPKCTINVNTISFDF